MKNSIGGDLLERRQYWHRQVKISAQAWGKISETKDKMLTSEFSSSAIVSAILANVPKSLSISRYDIDHNDQDRSIHRFFWSKEGLKKEYNLPICLTYKDPVVIIHLITDEVGFVSSKSEEVSEKFLNSIGE